MVPRHDARASPRLSLRPVTDETPPDQPAPDQPAPDAPASDSPAPGPGSATPRSRTVQYKGGDLEPERGPGLGCFWLQILVLAVLIILTPVSVSLGWPSEASAILLFITIGLLLLTGQTVIFLLRLVAADRRGRRRPLASRTKTVGELEDERPSTAASDEPAGTGDVRQ